MTLIELLVVLGIIAVLLGLLFPAILKVRETSNRTKCGNNLKQLAVALHSYESTNNRLPPSRVGGAVGWGPGSQAWSWLARLLPYVEHDDIYRLGGIPNTTLQASGVLDQTIPVFLCPSDAPVNEVPLTDRGHLEGIPVGQSNYKGVSGANWGMELTAWFATDWVHKGTNGSYDGLNDGDGMFCRNDYSRPLPLSQIQDGTSRTFMLGEDLPAKNIWVSWPYANKPFGTCAIPPNVHAADGGDYPPWNWHNVHSFRSRHPGGLNFAYADGSVHFISDSIDMTVYQAQSTINGGETAEAP